MDKTRNQNAIRGSLIGGAIGDALGYTIEFYQEDRIFLNLDPRELHRIKSILMREKQSLAMILK